MPDDTRHPSTRSIPLLGIAAFSGTGKTTLLTRLIPLLNERNVRVTMIKHAHHDFDIDTPGKDSYELRRAGAHQVLVASDRRSALITEYPARREPRLDELVAQLDAGAADLVLVEGFRHLAFPKLELHRASLGHPLLCLEDRNIIAVASDTALPSLALPRLDLNDPVAIGDFIIDWMNGAGTAAARPAGVS